MGSGPESRTPQPWNLWEFGSAEHWAMRKRSSDPAAAFSSLCSAGDVAVAISHCRQGLLEGKRLGDQALCREPHREGESGVGGGARGEGRRGKPSKSEACFYLEDAARSLQTFRDLKLRLDSQRKRTTRSGLSGFGQSVQMPADEEGQSFGVHRGAGFARG